MVTLLKLTPKEKKLILLIGVLLALGLVLRFYLPARDAFMARDVNREGVLIQKESSPQGKNEESLPPAEEKVIIVHITGAVANPGVYTLAEGSRVFQAVEKAGGHLEDADLERINLAQPLYDGQPIFVPRLSDRGSLAPGEGQVPGEDPSLAKVNINTANKAQLETLPGIGSVKAQNIINYREQHGYFKSIEDLINVNGIGAKTLEGMRDFVTIY